LPGLLKFFERWLAFDADTDGLPEWQHEIQTGYVYWPSFGGVQPWAENTDIEFIETPDLLAYLLSEAMSLQAIAGHLQDSQRGQQVGQHIQAAICARNVEWRTLRLPRPRYPHDRSA
jgi:hypothetical protein